MSTNTPQPLDVSTMVRRAAGQVHCTVADLIVLMKIDGGEYFELNRMGTRIWQELDAPATVGALLARLMRDFDVDQATCERDVLTWLVKMEELGFVER